MRTYFSYVSEVESRWSSQLLPQPDDDAEFLPEAPIPLGPQPKTVLDQNAAIESISRHIHTLRTNTNLKARAVAVQASRAPPRGLDACFGVHQSDCGPI